MRIRPTKAGFTIGREVDGGKRTVKGIAREGWAILILQTVTSILPNKADVTMFPIGTIDRFSHHSVIEFLIF